MPKKEQSSKYIEVSFPKYLIPVIVIVVIGLIALFVFLGRDKDENAEQNVEQEKETSQVEFSEEGIVEGSITVDVDEGVYLGDLENAKYAIVAFLDFQCGFCARHAFETLPRIQSELLKEDVVYLFREVAMMTPTEKSMALSILGQCIFENEGLENYLTYRSKAYEVNFNEDSELLDGVGVDATNTIKCFENREFKSRIENNLALSRQAGIQGVPGFIFGKLSQDGEVEGYLIPGAYPFNIFEEVLEALK